MWLSISLFLSLCQKSGFRIATRNKTRWRSVVCPSRVPRTSLAPVLEAGWAAAPQRGSETSTGAGPGGCACERRWLGTEGVLMMKSAGMLWSKLGLLCIEMQWQVRRAQPQGRRFNLQSPFASETCLDVSWFRKCWGAKGYPRCLLSCV